MNIHVARSAEQLAMTSDYINGRSTLAIRLDLFFRADRFVGLRGVWSIAIRGVSRLVRLRAIKEGQNLD